MEHVTREDWEKQLIEFRQMMGDKEAWTNGKTLRAAQNLLICWTKIDGHPSSSDSSLMQATMQEYDRRLLHMLPLIPNDILEG